MLPSKFVERINHQDYIDADSLQKALEDSSPSSIRINPAKWDRKPAGSEEVPWCGTGFYLQERPSFTPDPLFHAGCYYPQEASSMFIEQVLTPDILNDRNLKILDLCAAPGGKTTHISSLAGTGALIIANDPIRSRAALLADNVTKWGMPNTMVTRNDPAAFGRLEGFFDIIVVDAPCSGEGMFRSTVARAEWSEENAHHCALRQKRILGEVWPALSENGILVYSTCTFNPEENEENIRWLLENSEAEMIETDTRRFRGIVEIGSDKPFGYGFHPGRISGEGFFISAVRKKGRPGKVPRRSGGNGFARLSPADLKIAGEWSIFDREKIIRIGNDLYGIPGTPEEFSLLSGILSVVKPGTRICAVKNKDYLPSQDLALSTFIKKESFPLVELDFEQAVSYLRREEVKIPGAPPGWILPAYNSVNLGFAKNIGVRINNSFPVEWRIRMNVSEDAGSKIIKWE